MIIEYNNITIQLTNADDIKMFKALLWNALSSNTSITSRAAEITGIHNTATLRDKCMNLAQEILRELGE